MSNWMTVEELQALKPGECIEYTDTHGDPELIGIVVSVEGDVLRLQTMVHQEPLRESIKEIVADGYAYRISRTRLEKYFRSTKASLKSFQKARQLYKV